MARRHLLIGAIFVVTIGVLAVTEIALQRTVGAQDGGGTVQAPRFEVDPFWPKPLPNHWLLGSAIGVWVDERDHVWIIHRSSATLDDNEKGVELKTGECCAGAPPVLEFDPTGNLVQSGAARGRATNGRSPTTASSSITRETSGSAATAPAIRTSSSSPGPASSSRSTARRACTAGRRMPRACRPTRATATTSRTSDAWRRSSSIRATTRRTSPTGISTSASPCSTRTRAR